MIRIRHTQSRGFSAVEAVVVIVLLAALGLVGYFVYNRMQDQSSSTPSASEQTSDAVVPATPEVEEDDDLDTATEALDDTNLDAAASDNSELDSELSNF